MASTDKFVAAGLYDPATQSESGRLGLLNWLDELGITVEEMLAADAADSLGSLAGDRNLVRGELLTRDAAIALSGLDGARFDTLVNAFGLLRAEAAPAGEIGITAREVEAMQALGVLAEMFSVEEGTSFMRVVGSSIGRIGEAAVSLFLSDVESRMLSDGSSELELAHKVYDAISLLDGFTDQLDPLLRRHVHQAVERSRRTMIGMNERFQYRYAVGFVDLVGFTAMSGEMPAVELSRFLRDFEGRAHSVVTAAGARVVKLIGDEVMFVADDPSAACGAAQELMSGFGHEHARIVPRGGMAYGDVLMRGGDYYGSVVNLASRLVNEAVPQELLVTEGLAAAAPEWNFEPAGRRMVKGFDEPIVVRSLVAE